MAKIRNGLFSRTDGKVGPVVGQNWRGIKTLHSYSSNSAEASEAQATQRARYKKISDYARILCGTTYGVRPFYEEDKVQPLGTMISNGLKFGAKWGWSAGIPPKGKTVGGDYFPGLQPEEIGEVDSLNGLSSSLSFQSAFNFVAPYSGVRFAFVALTQNIDTLTYQARYSSWYSSSYTGRQIPLTLAEDTLDTSAGTFLSSVSIVFNRSDAGTALPSLLFYGFFDIGPGDSISWLPWGKIL